MMYSFLQAEQKLYLIGILISLSLISQFAKRLTHTNIVVASVPHCYDLLASSKVHQEICKFNRKLKKYVKLDTHVTVLDVDPDRSYFTNHGLHFNSKGKTNVCMQLKSVVEKLSTTYDRLLIPVEWIIGREVSSTMY